MGRTSDNLSRTRRPHAPQVDLRVRHMVASLAWLASPPRWAGDGAVWETGVGPLRPTLADLRAAAVALERLARRPVALALLVGDAHDWLAARASALAVARWLAPLAPASLPALEAQARAGQPAALGALAALLPAEALCRGKLSPSPTAILAGCGAAATQALRALLADEGAPMAGRALAAILLGARAARRQAAPPAPLAGDPLLRRAYAFGLRRGAPTLPRLFVALLAVPCGDTLAERFAAAEAAAPHCRLDPAAWHELLEAGYGPGRLVALAEAVATAEPLVAGLAARYSLAPYGKRRAPRAAHKAHDAVARLTPLLGAYLLSTGDPAAGRHFVRFVELTLAFRPNEPAPLHAAIAALDGGLALEPALRGAYLGLLVELHGMLWDPAQLPGPEAAPWSLLTALNMRQSRYVVRLRALLARLRDPGLVAAVARRGLLEYTQNRSIGDTGLFRWMLALFDAFQAPPGEVMGPLVQLLREFDTLPAARAALGAYLQAILAAPPALRPDLLRTLAERIRQTPVPQANALARLARYVPRLAEAAGDALPGWYRELTPGLLELDRRSPAAAPHLLEAALVACGRDGPRCGETLRLGLLLAGAAAPGDDPAALRAIAEAAARHALAGDSYRVAVGIAMLRRLPALAQTLALLFPQQPARTFRLLERLAMAAALGPDGLAGLAVLEPAAPGELLRPALRTHAQGWRELLALEPGAEGVAAAYLHAAWVLGAGHEVPAGARRALAQPARMAAERDHLARLVAAAPARADLAARLAALEARLADPAALWVAAGREAAARLAQITAEAQLAAAELLLEERFRARLVAIAGPLPPGLALDDELRNAVLLSADISPNRDLLRRLLRAELAGEAGWREAMPANAAFLAGLAARGAEAAAWLGEHPVAYELPGAAGGRVILALEARPLHVLQMGNYFGTCLSVGGGNAFSTVANAVDLNKRVIYARDAAGRVVGRKLIGVSAEGRLVGFHTYRSTGSPEADERLPALFATYARAFAAACGLELADQGTIPTLVAGAWYDDGEVAWGDGQATAGEGPGGLSRASSPLSSAAPGR